MQGFGKRKATIEPKPLNKLNLNKSSMPGYLRIEDMEAEEPSNEDSEETHHFAS